MPVRIVILKSRRAGLSTGVAALIFDDMTMHKNIQSLVVANESKPSENVLSMYSRFWRYMPEFLPFGDSKIPVRPPLPKQYQDRPSRYELAFDEPHNSKVFLATARSVEAYLSFAFQNIHATEAAHYVAAKELFANIMPTMPQEPNTALYIESTPNGQEGPGQWFYEQVMDANSRKNTQFGEMKLVFIPWHEMVLSFAIPFHDMTERRDFKRSLTPKERDLQKQFSYIRLEQLKWRRTILASPTFNRDEDIFDEKYPTTLAECFLTSGDSVYARKSIKRLSQNTREWIWEGDVYWGERDRDTDSTPIHALVRRPRFMTQGEAETDNRQPHPHERTYNNLKVWRWPRKGDRIFIAADVGGGDPETRDADWSTAYVGVMNELGKDEIIMRWKGHINPVDYAHVIATLAWGVRRRVGEDVVAPEVVPEWTGPGRIMLTHWDKMALYEPVYRYQYPGLANLASMPKSKHLGWESNDKTKPLMVGYSRRMVDRELIDVPDAELVLQMASYKQYGSYGGAESYGGAAGRHDDLVSAFQIWCAVSRMRASIDPRETEIPDVDMMRWEADAGDVPWDYADTPRIHIPGLRADEVDDETEDVFWHP